MPYVQQVKLKAVNNLCLLPGCYLVKGSDSKGDSLSLLSL